MTKDTILIIEDEESHSLLFQRAIQRTHPFFKIALARNGEQGLHYLHNQFKTVLLILLDLKMPVMTGFAFLQQFRQIEHFQFIPIVILTSSDDLTDRQWAQTYRVNQYLTKPIQYTNLKMLLSAHIDQTAV